MTSVAKCSDNDSATSLPVITTIAPVSAYHHASYAETYSRFRQKTPLIVIGPINPPSVGSPGLPPQASIQASHEDLDLVTRKGRNRGAIRRTACDSAARVEIGPKDIFKP